MNGDVMRDRRGFTLVEVVVVALLTMIVLGATYQVLVTNQRVYTAQAEQVADHGTVRAGLGVLSSELREISPGGADIVEMGATAVMIRTMRALGFACIVTPGPFITEFTLRSAAGTWSPGDGGRPVFVFADNAPGRTDDDVWLEGTILSHDPAGPQCPGDTPGAERMRISVLGLGVLNDPGDEDANFVHLGAPIRTFETHRYGLTDLDGQRFLARQTGGDLGTDVWDPLVGPLADEDGLLLEYFDAAGNPTTDPDDVRRIDVSLRTLSQARDLTGQRVAQSITTSIYTRN
jgi:hypothetical protein